MRKRVWILAFLALATALYQGYHIKRSFRDLTGSNMLMSRGATVKARNGNLEVIRIRPKNSAGGEMPALKAGLKKGDRILAFYDREGRGGEINGLFDFGRMTRNIRRVDPFTLKIERSEAGKKQIFEIKVPPDQRKSTIKRAAVMGSIAVILLLSMFTAFFIGFSKPEDDNAFTACLLLLCFSSLFGSADLSLPAGFRELNLIFYATMNTWIVYLFFRFFLLFPKPSTLHRKMPWLKTVFFWIMIVEWIVGVTTTLISGYTLRAISQFRPFLVPYSIIATIVVILMFLCGLVSLVMNVIQASSRADRRKLVVLLIGATIGIIPPFIFFIWLTLSNGAGSVFAILLFISFFALFPLSFAYVVLRHRVFGIRLIVRRGLQWALVSRGFLLIEGVLIFALLFFGLGPVIEMLAPHLGAGIVAMATAVLTAIILFGVRQVNRKIMPLIDKHFFREAYDARQILTELARAVRSMASEPVKLLHNVSNNVMHSLHPNRVAVFICGQELAALPSGADGFGPWSRAAAREMDGNFLCLVKESEGDPGINDGVYPVLLKDALSADNLKKATEDEPRAIEIYLDDSSSWARSLADSEAGDAAHAERTLLESLHARLMVPIVIKNRILGFLLLGEKRSEEPYSWEDKELLLTVAEQVATALDYSQLIASTAEQAVLKRDLEIATQVQQKLLPASTPPPVPGLDYYGMCKPARGVGGDYFDFLELDDDKLGLALGDISGKGVGAALLMASLQSMLRSQAPLRGEAVDELASAMNKLMSRSTDGSKFSTFFYGVFDPASRNFTYVNAGHNPPIILRKQEGTEPERIKGTGTLLGLFPESVFKKGMTRLEPGDIFVVFSDGVSEAFNEAEEEFGEDRLIKLLEENRDKDAKTLCSLVVEAVNDFAGAAPQSDDVTLVVARVTS